MNFRVGQLSATDAARLNEMWRALESLRRINAAAPLAINNLGGVPVISLNDATPDAWKQPARLASTTNVTLASPGSSLDGVAVANGDYVLLKDQTSPVENGIYVFNGSAELLTRAVRADRDRDFVGAVVSVSEGTTNANTLWLCTTPAPIDLGHTALTWVKVGADLTVAEVDGTPSYTGISSLQFDQADGFVVSQPSAGVARVDFVPPPPTDCTGCGWLAGLKQTECLEVLVNGVAQYVYLSSSDRLTWTSVNPVAICGTDHTVTVTKNAGGVPQLTLTGIGSGAPTYTGVFSCCVCKTVKWAFPLDVLCPDDTDPGDPCLNVVEVSARWIACCPIAGWKGAGWYCTRTAGTSDPCAAEELLEADKCNATIEICSGPYATELEASANCGSSPPDAGAGGTDCSSATAVSLGERMTKPPDPIGVGAFWKLNVTGGVTYHAVYTVGVDEAGTGAFTGALYTPDCAGAPQGYTWFTGPTLSGCMSFTPPVDGCMCLELGNQIEPNSPTVTMIVYEGDCP